MSACRPHRIITTAHFRGVLPLTAALLLSMLAATGCDEKRDLPPPPPATAPAAIATASTRPTTQELVAGNRKRVALGSPVLTIEVPASWKDTVTDHARWIEGYTPHGEVRLLVSSRGEQYGLTTIAAMEKKARSEAQADPEHLTVIPFRPLSGAAKAMERREILALPLLRGDGSREVVKTMDWSVEAFIPADKQFTIELLHFYDLTLAQYLQDKEFLEQIVNSLRYDATQGALQ